MLNVIMMILGALVSVISVCMIAYYDIFATLGICLLLIGMGMIVASGVLVYGAKTAATTVLKISNMVMLCLVMNFLFFSMLVSMATGDVDDLHKVMDDDWPNIKAKLDLSYCAKLSDADCKAKYRDEVKDNTSMLFVAAFFAWLCLIAIMVLTNSVVIALFHDSGGNLKNKIMGLTEHTRRLPEAEKIKLMSYRKAPPKLLTAEQNEAVVLVFDDEDMEPEDKEALDTMREGDIALHENDLDGALRCYITAQSFEPANKMLQARVKNARQQLAIEVANKKNIELYEFESAQEAEAAAKIQALQRGLQTKKLNAKREESAVMIQSAVRGKKARKETAAMSEAT